MIICLMGIFKRNPCIVAILLTARLGLRSAVSKEGQEHLVMEYPCDLASRVRCRLDHEPVVDQRTVFDIFYIIRRVFLH